MCHDSFICVSLLIHLCAMSQAFWRSREVILQVSFRKLATICRPLLRKITYKDKASYEAEDTSRLIGDRRHASFIDDIHHEEIPTDTDDRLKSAFHQWFQRIFTSHWFHIRVLRNVGRLRIHACVCICIYVYTCTHMCMYVYVRVFVCLTSISLLYVLGRVSTDFVWACVCVCDHFCCWIACMLLSIKTCNVSLRGIYTLQKTPPR